MTSSKAWLSPSLARNATLRTCGRTRRSLCAPGLHVPVCVERERLVDSTRWRQIYQTGCCCCIPQGTRKGSTKAGSSAQSCTRWALVQRATMASSPQDLSVGRMKRSNSIQEIWQWITDDGINGCGTVSELKERVDKGELTSGQAWQEGTEEMVDIEEFFGSRTLDEVAQALEERDHGGPSVGDEINQYDAPVIKEECAEQSATTGRSNVPAPLTTPEEKKPSHRPSFLEGGYGWRDLYWDHVTKGTQFIDAEFPCTAASVLGTSISNAGLLEEYGEDIQWCRLRDIVENVYFMKFSWLRTKSGIMDKVTKQSANTRISGITMMSAKEVKSKQKLFHVHPSWTEEISKPYINTAEAAVLSGMSGEYNDLHFLCKANLASWLKTAPSTTSTRTRDAAFFRGMQERAFPAKFEGDIQVTYFYTEYPHNATDDMSVAAANASGVNVPRADETAVVHVIVRVNFGKAPRALFVDDAAMSLLVDRSDAADGENDNDDHDGEAENARKRTTLYGQHQFDNSSLFAALGALALSANENPAKKMFPFLGSHAGQNNEEGRAEQQTLNDVGLYAVELFWKGEKKVVVVDDFVPCDSSGAPLFSRPLKVGLGLHDEKSKREGTEASRASPINVDTASTSNPMDMPSLAGEDYSCSFLNGPMGMVLGDGTEDGEQYVEVVEVAEGSQASKMISLQLQDRIVRIGETSVVGWDFDKVMALLKSSARPIDVGFFRAKIPGVSSRKDQVSSDLSSTDPENSAGMTLKPSEIDTASAVSWMPTEYWPLVVQKAYAKLHGSYHAVTHVHNLRSTMQEITGGVATTIHWTSERGYRDGMVEFASVKCSIDGAKTLCRCLRSMGFGEENVDTVFCARVRTKKRGSLFLGDSESDEEGNMGNQELSSRRPLISSSGHAVYVVKNILTANWSSVAWFGTDNENLSSKESKSVPKVILVHPWSCHTSPGMVKTHEIAADDPNMIVMPIDDFYEKFESVTVCHPLRSYQWTSRMSVVGAWKEGVYTGITSLNHPQFRIKVGKKCKAVISVEKCVDDDETTSTSSGRSPKSKRRGPSTIGLLVEKPLDEIFEDEIGKCRFQVGVPSNRVAEGLRYSKDSSCFVSVNFEPTEDTMKEPYVIIPITMTQDSICRSPFCLTIHSTEPLSIIPPEFKRGKGNTGYRFCLEQNGNIGKEGIHGRPLMNGGGAYLASPDWWKNPQHVFQVHSEEAACTVVLQNLSPVTNRRKLLMWDEKNASIADTASRGWVPIGFLVAHCTTGHETRYLTKKMFVGNSEIARVATLVETFYLTKGTYLIIPFGETPEIVFQYNLSIYSDMDIRDLDYVPCWRFHLSFVGEWTSGQAGGCCNNRITWLHNPHGTFLVGEEPSPPLVIGVAEEEDDSAKGSASIQHAVEEDIDEDEKVFVRIEILQHHKRTTAIGFLLYRGEPPLPEKPIFVGKMWNQNCWEGKLAPGKYTVMPQTFKPKEMQEFVVHIFSDDVDLRPVVQTAATPKKLKGRLEGALGEFLGIDHKNATPRGGTWIEGEAAWGFSLHSDDS